MSEQTQDGVPWWRTDPWNGCHEFQENRAKVPFEELMKYNGKYVAWFPDGSGICDSDIDPIALQERISASDDEAGLYLIEHITGEAQGPGIIQEMVMSEQTQDGVPWWRTDPLNGRHMFQENRAKFPIEELLKYNGKYVAWFPDGSGILDSDIDPIALEDRIIASGDDVFFYNIEHITDEPQI